jgi:hypothetical protein
MGFHRQGQPALLTRAEVVTVALQCIAEELAFAAGTADPFAIDHDCLNPAGHHFISSCGAVVCLHCEKVVWR